MPTQQARALAAVQGATPPAGHRDRDMPLAARFATQADPLDTSAAIMAGMLDALAEGAFVLRPDCTLLYGNGVARAMLASGGTMRLCDGRVRPTDPDIEAAFARMVLATATFGNTNAMCLRTPRGTRLTLTTKLARPNGGVLMLAAEVHRGERQTEAQLKSAFGLTPAEADIARSLSIGVSPAEIAVARGALLSTVQSQIKSIASKLGCRRQSEIIAIVQTMPQFVED